MSIYGTCWTLGFEVSIPCNETDQDRSHHIVANSVGPLSIEIPCRYVWVEVTAQAVPGHIKHTGPIWRWLPPPVNDETEIRAVFLIDDRTTKGTDRNGQEYVDPVLVMTGREYKAYSIGDLVERIEGALENRYGSKS